MENRDLPSSRNKRLRNSLWPYHSRECLQRTRGIAKYTSPSVFCQEVELAADQLPSTGQTGKDHGAVNVGRLENILANEPVLLRLRSQNTTRTATSALAWAKDAEATESLVVHARKVILAMPRRSLELAESSFFDDPWLKENLGSVLIQSALGCS